MLAGISAAITAEYPGTIIDLAGTLGGVRDCLAEQRAALLILHLEQIRAAKRSELQELRMSYPDLKILVIAPQESRETVLWYLDAGVHGVVGPSVTLYELREALQALMAGQVHVPPALAVLPDACARAQENLTRKAYPTQLTPRQTQVLKLLAEARSNKAIARDLGLGVGTVKVHLAHLFAALGARSRTEAIVKYDAAQRRAMEAGEMAHIAAKMPDVRRDETE